MRIMAEQARIENRMDAETATNEPLSAELQLTEVR
jgi:hypothetical protein